MGSDGTSITLHTNAGAPRYRLVRGDMAAAAAGEPGGFAASCADLIPQHERDLLQWCSLVKVSGVGVAGGSSECEWESWGGALSSAAGAMGMPWAGT